MASKFIIELMKKGAQKLSGQGKTTGKEGIKFIKPDVGKLDKIQKGKKKITDITDKYAVGFAKDNPKLLEKFRKNSKKNLDSISKIYKGKKDGGRMGLKGGGSDMSSTKNQSINSLKNFLEDRKNRKKSKIPTGTYAYMKRDRSPKEVDRVMSKLKSDAQAMGGDFKSVSELKPLKGESKKSFKSRPSTKFLNKGGRAGLKRGGGKFPDHSGDGKITQRDILMAKGVIPKTKSKSKKKVV